MSSVRDVEALRPLAEEACRSAGLSDVNLLLALTDQESKGNPNARSSAGAIGLTQLKLAAAKDAAERLRDPVPTESDLLNPSTSLRLGASYLQSLIERYGSADVALAAYFKGPGWVQSIGGPEAVRRWLQKTNEVTYYVTRVLDLAERLRARSD